MSTDQSVWPDLYSVGFLLFLAQERFASSRIQTLLATFWYSFELFLTTSHNRSAPRAQICHTLRKRSQLPQKTNQETFQSVHDKIFTRRIVSENASVGSGIIQIKLDQMLHTDWIRVLNAWLDQQPAGSQRANESGQIHSCHDSD